MGCCFIRCCSQNAAHQVAGTGGGGAWRNCIVDGTAPEAPCGAAAGAQDKHIHRF